MSLYAFSDQLDFKTASHVNDRGYHAVFNIVCIELRDKFSINF
ncbi:Uncharacterised protein [Vibrio cholerae]|nr:Uncharacterised protein [Vibrio cholerae]